MNNYANESVLEILRLKKNQNILKYAVENKHQPFIWSQFISATQEIEGVTQANLLKLLLTEEIYNTIDFSNIAPCNPNEIQSLISELREAVQFSKAIQTGFMYEDENRAPKFNANIFAHYFFSRVNTVVDEHGLIYTYSKEGVYKLLSDVELGKLIRMLMNEGLPNSWKKRHEDEAIDAIKREYSTTTIMNASSSHVNMKNGMYCLDTGILLKHNPKYFSTVQIPVTYKVKAKCPKFLQFIDDITCGDEQVKRVHQEILGYFLSSDTKSQKATIFVGWGANGKSVLAELYTILVGKENVSNISLAQFGTDFGLQGIIGKTVNIAFENEKNKYGLNTEVFKAMVSGDGITINRKHLPALTNYKLKCKFLFLTNQLPDTQDYTNGYFRRLMIIPFKRTFTEQEANPNLLEELKEELSGIFNWAMEGLKRLKENNYRFSESSVIENEAIKYKMSQQPVISFFDLMIELDESSKIKRSDLYDTYCQWHSENVLPEQTFRTRQKFYDELLTMISGRYLNVKPVKTRGDDFFKGIKFKEVG